jgi:uncharacterized protein (DUF2384 family)
MPALFESIPNQDYLNFKEGKKLHYNRIASFLDLKQDEVSNATGVPKNTIRYDDRMPQELKERLNEWATLLNLVAGHFQGDRDKTIQWFVTPNPLLGYISPRDMIKVGRFKKLLKFVYNALNEHKT